MTDINYLLSLAKDGYKSRYLSPAEDEYKLSDLFLVQDSINGHIYSQRSMDINYHIYI